ncbi:MAG: sigma factor [Prevotellaceae bacterium]|nr:sigma factor [Prevotellaceae bacterium]
MIRLWTYCQHLDASRNLEAFAVKVAKNVCINMHRSRRQHQENSSMVLNCFVRQIEMH